MTKFALNTKELSVQSVNTFNFIMLETSFKLRVQSYIKNI